MTVADERTGDPARSALDTGSARPLATTTKTPPQSAGISPRWLLRALPWVAVEAGTYRRNARRVHDDADGTVAVLGGPGDATLTARGLRGLAVLRAYADDAALTALAGRFVRRELEPGETVAVEGEPVGELVVVAHGKIGRFAAGRYGEDAGTRDLGLAAHGEPLGAALLTGTAPRTGPDLPTGPDQPTGTGPRWPSGLRAITRGTVLVLSRASWQRQLDATPELRRHVERWAAAPRPPRNKYGEAAVAVAAGHTGEHPLPGTFVDYRRFPREYPMSVAQTTVRVHTRVSDLYDGPMDQTAEQLRLALAELRERQERDLLVDPGYGLLANVAPSQLLRTRHGPPGPEDMDALLSRRRSTAFFLAHPRGIAAFRRACSERGVVPDEVPYDGVPHTGWRGVPVLPSDKVPVSATGATSILAMRIGEDSGGVVGLRPAAVPDETEPGVSVRSTGIDALGVRSYLVSAYQSAAVLVPDALGVLADVETGSPGGAR